MADGDVLSITISDDTAAGGSNGAGFGGVIVVDNTGGTYSASATTSTTGIKLYRNLPSVRKWYDDDTHWQPIKSFATPVVNGSTLEVPFDVYVPMDGDLTVKVDAPAGWLTEGGSDAAAISMVTATNNSTRTIDRRYAVLPVASFKGNPYASTTGFNSAAGLNFRATTVRERQTIFVDTRNFTASTGDPWRDVEYSWTFEQSAVASPSVGTDSDWEAIADAATFEDKATGQTVSQANELIGPIASFEVVTDGGPGNKIRVTCTPRTMNGGVITDQTPVQDVVTVTPLTETTRAYFSPDGDDANDGFDNLGLGGTFNFTASSKALAATSGSPFSGVTLQGDERDAIYLTPVPPSAGTALLYTDLVQAPLDGSTLPNLGTGNDITLTNGTATTRDGVDVVRDARGVLVTGSANTSGVTVIALFRNQNTFDNYLSGHDSSNNDAWRFFTNADFGFRIYDSVGTTYTADWSTSGVNNTGLRAFVARHDGATIDTRYDAGAETFSVPAAVSARAWDRITIGSTATGSSTTDQGDTHFVAVWDSVLSDTQVEAAEAILYARIGRALPSGHTFEGVSLDAAHQVISSIESGSSATLDGGWANDLEVSASGGPDLSETATELAGNNVGIYIDGPMARPDVQLTNSTTVASDGRRMTSYGTVLTADSDLEMVTNLAATSLDVDNTCVESFRLDGDGFSTALLASDAGSTGTLSDLTYRDTAIFNTRSISGAINISGGGFSLQNFDMDRTAADVQNRTQIETQGDYLNICGVNIAGYANEGVLAHAIYVRAGDAQQIRGLHVDECHTGANYAVNLDGVEGGTAGNPATKILSSWKYLAGSRLGNTTNGLDLSTQQNTRHEDGGDDGPQKFVVVEDNVFGPCGQWGLFYYVCDDVTLRRCAFYGCGTGAINCSDSLGVMYLTDNNIFLDTTDGDTGIRIGNTSNNEPHEIIGNRFRIDDANPKVLDCSFTAMAASVTAGATFDDNLVYVPNDTSGGKIIYDRDTLTAKTVAEFETAVGLSGGTSFTIVSTETELGWKDSASLLLDAVAEPSPPAAPAGSTGAYAYAGERFVYIVFDAGITYTEPGGFFVYPVTVSKPGGLTEAVNSLEVVSGNTLKIGFTGDTPAIGDSNWTVTLNNSSGYITTTSNGAPVANFTDLAVAVTSQVFGRPRDRSRRR